ncbi:TetR/AcrR family transcriptional regulator [Paenibacillus sp. EC2-1]|uniref:TetR/AcrR family transcriptional regulator n=1 Tax=Paenibacillus sp. EC2-1 TaxID=3388665 RepID=UPI003BEEC329
MMPRVKLDVQMIMQAAADIADKEGLDEVTLASLSKKLGIRSPSLYNHVDGLNGVRHKLALYGMKQLNEALTYAAIGRAQDEAIHEIAQAYIRFAREHPGLYDALVRMPDWNDEETNKVARLPVDLLVRVLQAYGLEGDAAIHTVRGLHSLLHGFASLEQTGNFNIPIDPDYSLQLLIDFFLKGIRAYGNEMES